MAGRILDKSIQEVRERARIDDIVGQYVTLRSAGGGSYKGLCPFHDEKSPSFNVNPSRGFFHCFGCGAGGDVFDFVQRIDGLSFLETVERLAEKLGVRLEREEGGAAPERRGPARGKLVEAHKIAAEFFAEQLLTPAALPARRFLAERSFDQAAAQLFGVGFAPMDGKSLLNHLRGRGFSQEELVVGGLVRQSGWDVFSGRVVWPIRESSGDVIGFGARKLFDDDRISGKYINTSETPIYKKNQVLYGIDLAREGMRKSGQAVVVEGYTDVMACHLSGITTAVATCGTAFTPDHGKVVRRFMADFSQSSGEVVFTFDGDSAGQAAAMKVFAGDQEFLSQTYVAVAPDGLDPCDLRLQQGEEAVRELIAGRQPLYRFVLRNVVATHDLDRADGRIDALREGARLVSSVRDRSKVDAFARELAQLVGADPGDALREVRRVQGRDQGRGQERPQGRRQQAEPAAGAPAAPAPVRAVMPDPRDPRLSLERETLKVFVQHPVAVGRLTAEIAPDDFTHPAYRAVWQLIAAAGGPGAGANDPAWASRLGGAAGSPELSAVISALAVEALPSRRDPDAAYVAEHVIRLREATLQRRIAEVHSRLQRADPAVDPEGYRALFAELAELEQRRRTLRSPLEGTL
jgi:DNA primase